FDEDVFEDPFSFNILRDPNPHLTFGGNGPHYCIGANLAKLQIELIFNAIADHMPDITSMGEATRLRSGWLNAINDWKVDFKCPVRASSHALPGPGALLDRAEGRGRVVSHRWAAGQHTGQSP